MQGREVHSINLPLLPFPLVIDNAWERSKTVHLFTDLTISLAMIELRLVLAHFAYLFDAQLFPTTDPGYHYTVVIHPGPVYALLTPVSGFGSSG